MDADKPSPQPIDRLTQAEIDAAEAERSVAYLAGTEHQRLLLDLIHAAEVDLRLALANNYNELADGIRERLNLLEAKLRRARELAAGQVDEHPA